VNQKTNRRPAQSQKTAIQDTYVVFAATRSSLLVPQAQESVLLALQGGDQIPDLVMSSRRLSVSFI